jgi:hypothetical protein
MSRHRSQACDVRTREECVAGTRGPGGGCGGIALLRILCWLPRPRGGGRVTDMVAWSWASLCSHYRFMMGQSWHISCALERGPYVTGGADYAGRNFWRWLNARYLHFDGRRFRYCGQVGHFGYKAQKATPYEKDVAKIAWSYGHTRHSAHYGSPRGSWRAPYRQGGTDLITGAVRILAILHRRSIHHHVPGLESEASRAMIASQPTRRRERMSFPSIWLADL